MPVGRATKVVVYCNADGSWIASLENAAGNRLSNTVGSAGEEGKRGVIDFAHRLAAKASIPVEVIETEGMKP